MSRDPKRRALPTRIERRAIRRGLAAVPAIMLAAATPAGAQDRALAVPEMRVLLENDRVRVQYHDVAPGETTPLHSHPAYVAYVFTDYVGLAILSDGEEIALSRRAGEVFYSGPVMHRIRNTGATPIHNLIVELRAPDGE